MSQVDLDAFYSEHPVEVWREVIGEALHFHWGDFSATGNYEIAMRQAVLNFWDVIPQGARVLDAGCGWGATLRMLVTERGCDGQGVTISRRQAGYCREIGLDVIHDDLEAHRLTGHYDAVLMFGVLSHIRDKVGLLKHLREHAARLILSEDVVSDAYTGTRTTFHDTMIMQSQSELLRDLEAAGWPVERWRNRRDSAMPTFFFWRHRLQKMFGADAPTGIFAALDAHTLAGLRSPVTWAAAFPLIDLVAG